MEKLPEQFAHSREATRITLAKVSSWEELNATTLEEGNRKFSEKTKELWKDFAVSGTLQFDPKEGKQVLRPFTDLDGKSAVGILDLAGMDTSNLKYIRPGEFLEGAINLDTGDKFGVVYEEPTYTAFFDHHAPGTKEVTSTTEIVYKTMIDLGMVEKSEALDRLVKFVTDIDNRRLLATEFLKSGKTIIGVQRDLDFKKMLEYFKDHESPTEELTPEEFEKYGLKESSERQQRTVDESMATLTRMETERKVIQTKYGSIVINENNELKTGSSAAYVRHDGIINFTSGKSFAVTLKEKDLDEKELREKLGDKFQGKIIRGKIWLYNDAESLNLSLEEIIGSLGPVAWNPKEKIESVQENLKQLTEKEIEKIIEEIKNTIMPFYDEIEKLRKANPEREVGGRIRQGKLELLDESKWKKNSVVGESYEEERKMAKEGILSFHTHPDKSMTNESAQDILSAYFRLNELIFHEYGMTLLIALKELPVGEIIKIDEQAWQDAQQKEDIYGDPAYWFWKGILSEKLPVRKIDIIDKLQSNKDKIKN